MVATSEPATENAIEIAPDESLKPTASPLSGVQVRMQNLRKPWQPGQSGNPSGVAKGYRKDLPKLAREWTEEAIATLAEIMRSSDDDRNRVVAAVALLDRGWGRPRESKDAEEIAVAGWETMSWQDKVAFLQSQKKGKPTTPAIETHPAQTAQVTDTK